MPQLTEEAQLTKVAAVQFERLLAAPIERVWEFLTEPAAMPGWYGDGTIEQKPGGVVQLMGGHIRGIITQWKPLRRLTYTWNVFSPDNSADDDDSPYPESYVTFELKQQGSNVLLSLSHLPVLEQFEKQNAMGWHTFLDMLAVALAGGAPEPRAVYMKRNAQLYDVDLSNLAK